MSFVQVSEEVFTTYIGKYPIELDRVTTRWPKCTETIWYDTRTNPHMDVARMLTDAECITRCFVENKAEDALQRRDGGLS